MSMKELIEKLPGVKIVIDEHGDDRYFLVTGGEYASIKKVIDDWNDEQGEDWKQYKYWDRLLPLILKKLKELKGFMDEGSTFLDGFYYCHSGDVKKVIKSNTEKKEYIENLLIKVREIHFLGIDGEFCEVYEMARKLKDSLFDFGKAVYVPYHIAIKELVNITTKRVWRERSLEVSGDNKNAREGLCETSNLTTKRGKR